MEHLGTISPLIIGISAEISGLICLAVNLDRMNNFLWGQLYILLLDLKMNHTLNST